MRACFQLAPIWPVLALLISVTPAARAPAPLRPLPPGVAELHVEDLHCNGCAKKLARKLYATPGVKRVRAFVAEDKAVLTLQKDRPAAPAELWRAAEQAGQTPTLLRLAGRRYEAGDFEPPPAAR